MALVNLVNIANNLPHSWSSSVLGQVGHTQFKVLRMDESAYVDETHDFSEVLLVIEGQLNLIIHNETVMVKAGEAYIIPANTPHSVGVGSFGTLAIIDPTS